VVSRWCGSGRVLANGPGIFGLSRKAAPELSFVPRGLQVVKKHSEVQQAKRSRCKAFIKMVNYNHIMPTRYTLDVDFKSAVTPDVLETSAKKVAAGKACKELLEQRFKTGKNRWFFTKLRF